MNNHKSRRDKKLSDFAERHGNAFHGKVVNFFLSRTPTDDSRYRSTRWEVVVSPYFTDSFTDKPRETDIIVEQEIFDSTSPACVGIKLIIECKSMAKEREIVFWFYKKDMARAKKEYSNSGYTHYLKDHEVAKLYATVSDSTHKEPSNELFFKATTQALNAFIFYRNRDSIIPADARRTRFGNLQYPLIVLDSFDGLFKKSLTGNDKPKQISDGHFQLEINYAYPDKNGDKTKYFLIDVVEFAKLESFLAELKDQDVDEVLREAITSRGSGR